MMKYTPDLKTVLIAGLVVFPILYKALAMAMGLQLKAIDLVVPALIFTVLVPGFLLEIPAQDALIGIQTGHSSIPASAVHALVGLLVAALLRRQFPQFY
jgi:hypothetical protein